MGPFVSPVQVSEGQSHGGHSETGARRGRHRRQLQSEARSPHVKRVGGGGLLILTLGVVQTLT